MIQLQTLPISMTTATYCECCLVFLATVKLYEVLDSPDLCDTCTALALANKEEV